MNRKGFTLIELLAVIVLIAIIIGIVAPNVIGSFTSGKEKSYEIMINNIVTASKEYYEECNYSSAAVKTKIKCSDHALASGQNGYSMTLGELVKFGYLTGTTENNDDGNTISVTKTIKNPKTQKDISACKVQIERTIEEGTKKVVYTVSSDLTKSTVGDSDCPIDDDFKNNNVGTVN